LFSPFWEATPAELAYCKRLKEWWEAMLEEKRRRDGEMIVVEIGGRTDAAETSSVVPKREHRLICDAGPGVQPGGWFKCTVEVWIDGAAFSSSTYHSLSLRLGSSRLSRRARRVQAVCDGLHV
jgi:hypothetical protein